MKINFFNLSRLIVICLVFSAITSSVLYAEELYQWTDNEGVRHYTDTKVKIPERYRDDVNSVKPPKDSRFTTGSGSSSKGPDLNSPATGASKNQHTFVVPFRDREGSSRRIIVDVTINNSVTVPFALDTGSPGMIISSALAEQLGLLEKKKGILLSRAGGIGGTAPAIRTIIDNVELGGARDSFIPTTVIDNMSNRFYGLIGMDFMSKYSIYIDHESNSLLLREIPESEDRPGGRSKSWWVRTFREFNAYRDAWADLKKQLDDYKRNTIYNTDMTDNNFKSIQILADWQYDEASRLMRKLEKHARNNSVPTSWWR